MLDPLASIQPVIAAAHSVSLNMKALSLFADGLGIESLAGAKHDPDMILEDRSEAERIAFIMLCDAINFCFWGNPKWALERNGKALGGSASLPAALRQGLDEGYPLLDPGYLAKIPEEDLRHITVSPFAEIPLLAERVRLLRIFGATLMEKFAGSCERLLAASNCNAWTLVTLLVEAFPAVFDDCADYDGQSVAFYKRAQLVPSMLADLYSSGFLSQQITGLEKLTGLADYKVPQMLRRAGILTYVPDLAEKIAARTELVAGSRQEVEIRAFTILAVELIRQAVAPRLPGVTAVAVDNALWLQSQNPATQQIPYHRTLTVWY